MTIGFLDLLNIITFVSGSTIAIMLISRWQQSIAYCFLAAFVFTYISGSLTPVFFRAGIYLDSPSLIYFPFNWSVFSLAILHGFLKSLSDDLKWNKIGWTFLVPLLVISSHFYFWSLPNQEKIAHLANGQWQGIYYNYRVITFGYSLFMIGITLRAVKNYQKNVDQFYSEGLPFGFNWVKTICYFLLAIMIPIMFPQSAYPEGVFPYVAISFTCLAILLVIWIGIEGMNQKFMYLSSDVHLEDIQERKVAKEPSNEQSDGSLLAEHSLLDHIVEEISSRQLYRSVDLNLNHLANDLDISARKLSNLINQQSGKNFRNFINAFRIEHAQKQLDGGALHSMNMTGLALESGFKSKTTFYSAFKQEVGTTPLEYSQRKKTKTR